MHHDSEAPDEADGPGEGRRRSRAADLFSTNRYRQLQVRWFEDKDPDAIDDADDYFDPIVQDDTATMIGEFAPIRGDSADAGAAFAVPRGQAPAVEQSPLEPVDADTPKPRRNMGVATLVGVPILVFALFAAWWEPLAFAVVIYGMCIAGAIEWGRALARQRRKIPLIPIVAAIIGMGISTWYALAEGLVVALLVGCAGVVAWRLSDERIENTLADSMASMLTLMWIPFLASFMLLLELPVDGWKRVFIVILAVVGNDTGGLLFGSRFGKHKLLPRVSPGKTWEGFAGGVLLGTGVATLAAYYFFDGAWYIGAAVGFAATLAAVVGDLAESAIKRDMNLKDMSSVLPGHGGILDRLDSMVFAAPVAYVVFAIFLGTL